MGNPLKKKAEVPKFPDPPKKDGGKETKQPKITKEQEQQIKISQQIQELQNNGIYRLTKLDLLQQRNSISIETNEIITQLGQKLIERLDKVATALENLGETPEEETKEDLSE